MPTVDPGWTPPNLSFAEWLLAAAWTVTLAVGGWIVRRFSALHRKVEALEIDVTKIEADLVAIDRKVDERHGQNTSELTEFREFLTAEMRELRRRIDRLLERGVDPPSRSPRN